jgi:hypothetical protein
MNKDTEEKVMMLLRALSEKKNWKLIPQYVDNKFVKNFLLWEKEHYDPMYVAQELLEQLSE